MSGYIVRMLFMQGYQRDDIISNRNLNLLARWTPFACGCLGTLGLIIIPLAFGAAFTQWCFASALYRLVFRRKEDCC
jgi:hypothetical protein